jgi:hypothetical protein
VADQTLLVQTPNSKLPSTPTGFQTIAKGWTDGSCRPTLVGVPSSHPTLEGLHKIDPISTIDG